MVNWKRQIFKQKSLWEVYFLSRRVMPRVRKNVIICAFFAVCLVFLYVASVSKFNEAQHVLASMAFTREVSEVAFLISLGLLGFLIAGFSIFASISNPKLFVLLASHGYKDTGINRLQYILFNFLNVFTKYLVLISTSLVLKLGFIESSPISYFLEHESILYPRAVIAFSLGLGLLLCFWIVVCIVGLKSFIWNLYQAVLLTIASNDILDKLDEKKPKADEGL